MPRYNYDSYRDVPPATPAEWRKAYEDAPACHHPSPTIKTVLVTDRVDIAERVIARLATGDLFERELPLIEAVERVFVDQTPDFPA